ncbi:hypothetical protein ADL29_35005 [Streptomyces chattanoogensis]|uniref:Uncharacterized protein n=1 Tax=Streptomyces chattanoogensis TaxID=66876 RepID=A0A0N0GVL1_9ACTN|nr:hypothetical protein ADL29_35005 [Streptomyces chattanoogensis]
MGGGQGAPPGGSTGRVLVRPRPAEPFERIEALRNTPAGPDDPAPLLPQAPLGAVAGGDPVRYEREVRTVAERETVVRMPRPGPPDGPERPAPQLRVESGLLRPVALPDPGSRTAPTVAVRPRGRAGEAGEDASVLRPGVPSPAPRGAQAAPRAVAAALRPRTDEVPAPRDAARAAAAARRGQRPAERVVHVQIGRLEVSAAGAERPARGTAARPERTERRGPSLSLADYLSRDEKRN